MPQKSVLPVIVIVQFFCTSLWFAGNAVMNNLMLDFDLGSSALGHLTTAVQFGFISGTFVFALLCIVDRFSPSTVFCFSACCAALFNLGVIWNGNSSWSILLFRVMTGFFLAGIYPVGMKIAADYFEKGLGKALGFLVGALVLGTALPHALKDLTETLPWKYVIIGTSCLAVLGGLSLLAMVPNGPYRKKNQKLDLSVCFKVFKNKNFRTSAFGYFGHMWELYTFWAFVPIILEVFSNEHGIALNIPLLSFLIIGIGGMACVLGGYLAMTLGTQKTAFYALLLSGTCCLISPWMFALDSEIIFVGFLLFWGMTVIADSPLFSTLVAQNAPSEMKGTALTIVNCIGFSITIISIQLITTIREMTGSNSIYVILGIGPIIGIIALLRNPITQDK